MADQTLHGTNTRGATGHMGSTDTYDSQVHVNQRITFITPHHVFVKHPTDSSENTHYIKQSSKYAFVFLV